MDLEPTPIDGVVVVRHQVFEDDRGFFVEAFRADEFEAAGLPSRFVQLNHSSSKRGVVRGLHFQWEPPMGKLMRVIRGRAFLVAVDIRTDSPTLGRWFGLEARASDHVQLWGPPGCARGFCVLSEEAEIQYLCTGTYNPEGESGIRWDDPAIGIEWPVEEPILSSKDENAPLLSDWLARPESGAFR